MPALTVRPFLMFQGEAATAIAFYLSVFPDARLIDVEHYPTDGAGRTSLIKLAVLSIAGQEVMCTDSPVPHEFTFTPAFSFFIDGAEEAQVDALATALKEGGTEHMPAGAYGFGLRFAWVSDRFGVSWQINSPLREARPTDP